MMKIGKKYLEKKEMEIEFYEKRKGKQRQKEFNEAKQKGMKIKKGTEGEQINECKLLETKGGEEEKAITMITCTVITLTVLL